MKEYLGDGVYVQISPVTGDLVLTTENGIEATNIIVMEMEVLAAFQDYVERTIKRGPHV
jgi:hypothetical protein